MGPRAGPSHVRIQAETQRGGAFLTFDSPHRFPVPSLQQRVVPRLCQGLDLGRRCLPG